MEPSFTNQFGRLITWAEMNDTLRFQFEVGTNIFYLNDTIGSLPGPTYLANNTLYIPLRFILELCGYQVHWVDAEEGHVRIYLSSPAVSKELPDPGEHNPAQFLSSHFMTKARNVPVLLYHHILPDAEHDGSIGTIVSVEDFAEQMTYLYKNGYHTVGLADLYLFIREKKALPHW